MEEPAAVPTLDDISSQLEAGNQAYSVDPFSEPGNGLVVESPGEKEEIRAEDLAAELAELRSELDKERKRRTDAGAEYYRADNARQIAEGVVQSLQQVRQQENAAMQQIANSRPPTPDNPEELLEDPAKLVDAINKAATWGVGTALAAMQPTWQQVQYGTATLQQLSTLAQNDAFDRARWEINQMGFDDFDEARAELAETFKQYGLQGEQMMLDPEKLINGYLMLRRRKGLPMATKGGSKAPDVLPDSPDLRAERAQSVRRLGPMAAGIAKMIGVKEIKATPDDLYRVGLARGE